MDFSKLYVLFPAAGRGAIHLDGRLPDGMCSRRLTRGEEYPGDPLFFDEDKGSRWMDILDTTYAVLQICSGAFFDVLEKERFSGWKDYSVIIRDKAGNRAGDGYRGLAIVGRSGPIDDAQSKVENRPPRVERGRPCKVKMGVFFSPETWDGSDLFMIGDATLVVVTHRVLDALQRHKLKGFGVTRLSEFERPVLSA